MFSLHPHVGSIYFDYSIKNASVFVEPAPVKLRTRAVFILILEYKMLVFAVMQEKWGGDLKRKV